MRFVSKSSTQTSTPFQNETEKRIHKINEFNQVYMMGLSTRSRLIKLKKTYSSKNVSLYFLLPLLRESQHLTTEWLQ